MEFAGIVVAIFLGALMGFQREFSQQEMKIKRFAGIRTFILITLMGAILGFLGSGPNTLLVAIGFVAIIILVITSYVLDYMKSSSTSATTEVAAIMAYIVGVMCVTEYMKYAIIFAILITAFLAFKEKFHETIKNMDRKEVFGVIKFAIVSLVILPILPDKNYSPLDIPGFGEMFSSFGIDSTVLGQLDVFNFYHIWLMVILVAGISFLGYFLVKVMDSKKSYALLGFVGGLVSSTAVTLSMAAESKKNKKIVHPFVLATIIAMTIMFIRVIFEVAIVNNFLLKDLFFPLFVMFALGVLIAIIFLNKKSKDVLKSDSVEFKQPFALVPALKFGGLFLLVLFIARLAQLLFGDVGLYFTSVLSGLADVDAITLSMASLSKAGEIDSMVATTSIMLAVISNTLVKVGIAFFFGGKKFGRIILGVFSLVLLAGLGVLFLL